MQKQMGMRIERDSLGDVAVPHIAYYGAQTVRAIANFPISGTPVSQYPLFIRAFGYVKKAAATANFELNDLPEDKYRVVAAACDEIIDGSFLSEFPVDVFQGGAGTSVNMNANEVIANRALEILGHERGRYDLIHPNNDVNMSQSTNDVYPTALRLALLLSYRSLSGALEALALELKNKGREFSTVVKLGRTQLQDAVPMTLGQEFQAFSVTLLEDVERLDELVRFFREVNLGGTAIGTGVNTRPEYQAHVIASLSAATGIAFKAASNLVEASWDTGAYVLFSGMLKRTATKLSKICNDLRLLSSGPRGGLNEINLPARQPGSSIMPGKINPVIPEVVNQVVFQVIGADLTVTLAAEAGQLQLNAMEPVIAHNLLNSINLLTSAAVVLEKDCVGGITANVAACREHLEHSTAAATVLGPIVGYERAAAIAKAVLDTGRSIREVLADEPDLPHGLIDNIALSFSNSVTSAS